MEPRPPLHQGPLPQECFINKVSAEDKKSEHLSIVGSSSYNPTGGGGVGRRGWPPEPQAQASEETGVSRNVAGLLSIPSWGSLRTMCKLGTGPRAWNTNYPATLDYALHSRDWVIRGGGLLGASQGRWQKCASIKRGQPASSPACKGASVGPRGGLGQGDSYPACLGRNFPDLGLLSPPNSPSFLEPR